MKIKFVVKSLVVLCIITSSVVVNAAFNDISPNANYLDAVTRTNALKLIGADDNGFFKPNGYVTKEQFVRVVIKTIGSETLAKETKYVRFFDDIGSDRWSSPYITYSVNEGIIIGNGTGNFNPDKEITFAEASTILVNGLKVRGVTGVWPESYIEEARKQGLLDGINFEYYEKLPRWAVAQMIDKLWAKNLKENNNFNFNSIDLSQVSDELIVLGNSITDENIKDNQILTNRGVFYNSDYDKTIVLGGTYKAFVYEDTIAKIFDNSKEINQYRVVTAVGTELNLVDKDGIEKLVTLSSKIKYYYKGEIISFEEAKKSIKYNSTVTFGLNQYDKDYEYVVIFDPLYMNPVVVNDTNILGDRIGNIRFSKDLLILKRDKLITREDIKLKDLIYFVTDINKDNPYLLVMDKFVEGVVTDIKPNKLSPNIIQIDGLDYSISKNYDITKLNSKNNYLAENSFIEVIIDKDGKIIDIYENTLNYAFVINYEINVKSEDSDGVRRSLNRVKLLQPNGEIKWYTTEGDPKFAKNKLIKYTIVNDDTIEIETQKFFIYEDMQINKSDEFIGELSVDKNIKIYNLIESTFRTDTRVDLIQWRDMPSGTIPGDKIYHMSTYGDFDDVNIMVVKDIFDESYKVGYINKNQTFSYFLGKESYNYSFEIDGRTYSYSTTEKDMEKGEAYLVKINSNSVSIVERKLKVAESSNKIQALDGRRIKLNNKVYNFDRNVIVYLVNKSGLIEKVNQYEIDIDETYKEVTIFTDDRTYNLNRIKLIVVQK